MDIISKIDINNQIDILKLTFNMLDMHDVVNDFYKETPYYSNSLMTEYAHCDMVLEEICCYGTKCLYKNNPLICPKNHQLLLKTIKKNTIIPKQLCKYERPWKNMKCINIYCWYAHLKGRSQYMEILKIKHNIKETLY